MRSFMDEDFLLSTPTARKLYHTYAENCPIIDYHCHLSSREIAEDHEFSDIGKLMLGGDHYKWRAMSAFGFDNDFIRRSDMKERFFAFAKAIPYMMGNPIYHWTHLELKRVFGIDCPLNEKTAQYVWDTANELLHKKEYRAKGLIKRFNVKLICTTDDPVDDLAWHRQIAQDASFGVRVVPAFRPDKAIKITQDGFCEYIAELSSVCGKGIASVRDLVECLRERAVYFHSTGARVSDHGLDTLPLPVLDRGAADTALQKALKGQRLDRSEADAYRAVLLTELGGIYRELGWVQQYHISALRNVNTPLFSAFGPDSGGDTVNDDPIGDKLAFLLDAQEKAGGLPKTILYTLNPGQNYLLAAMAGSFQGGIRGKIQFGSAWWFGDQLSGMRDQMTTLASIGLLPTFIGMLTDSRSFVSYTRHEYFRRLLCDIIGKWVEDGEYPDDEETVGGIVKDICYNNAREYLGIDLN